MTIQPRVRDARDVGRDLALEALARDAVEAEATARSYRLLLSVALDRLRELEALTGRQRQTIARLHAARHETPTGERAA